MSKYDKTFDEKELALYNYDATYKKVEGLFNKYRMFKEIIKEFYERLGSTSKVFGEKVCESNRVFDQTSKKVEQIIDLKNFVDYCEIIIKAHIKELNYYEKWIFNDVIVGDKSLSSIEKDKKCDRSHGFLSSTKKSCVIKVSIWFGIYVLNDTLFEELNDYRDYDM